MIEASDRTVDFGSIGRIRPPRPSVRYYLALIAAGAIVPLVPAVYVASVLGFAYFVGTLIIRGHFVEASAAWAGVPFGRAAYFGVVCGGPVAIALMMKPIWPRPRSQPLPFAVEPERCPRLFEFIGRLSEALGTPSPTSVFFVLVPNASAFIRPGFWLTSRDVRLTIGLPLAATLALPEFAGVLAHELGHCAQPVAMGVAQCVGRIDAWLDRAARHRDRWDHLLLSGHGLPFLWPVSVVALSVVTACRWELTALARISRFFSGLLGRQMEYHADLFQARLVGTDSFHAVEEQMYALYAAHAESERWLEMRWTTGRLPDDQPALFADLYREHGRRLTSDGIAAVAAQASSWFDLHPPPEMRVAAVSSEPREAAAIAAVPASVLFDRFDDLCRSVTHHDYVHWRAIDGGVLGRLESTATMKRLRDQWGARYDAAARILFDVPLGGLGVLHGLGASRQPSHERPLTRLDAARRTMASLAPGVGPAARARQQLAAGIRRLQALRRRDAIDLFFDVTTAGVPPADFIGVPFHGDAIERTQSRMVAQQARLDAELGPFRSALLARIDAAIELASPAGRDDGRPSERDECQALVAIVQAIDSEADAELDAGAAAQAIHDWLGGQQRDPLRSRRVTDAMLLDWWAWQQRLSRRVAGMVDPTATCREGPLDEFVRARQGEPLMTVIERVRFLRYQCLLRLLELVESIERGHGVTPAADVPVAAPTEPLDIPELAYVQSPPESRRCMGPGTAAMLGVPLTLFLIMVGSGVPFASPADTDLVRWGAAYGPAVINGEWWRLMTATLVHAGPWSLLAALCLVVVNGRIAEPVLGPAATVAGSYAAGACGVALSVLVWPDTVSADGLAPACGLAGLAVGATVSSRRSLRRAAPSSEVRLEAIVSPARTYLLGLVVIAMCAILYTESIAGNAWLAAPAFSAFPGYLAGDWLTRDALAHRPSSGRVAAALAAMAISVALVAGVASGGTPARVDAYRLAALEHAAVDEVARFDAAHQYPTAADAAGVRLEPARRVMDALGAFETRAQARIAKNRADRRQAASANARTGAPIQSLDPFEIAIGTDTRWLAYLAARRRVWAQLTPPPERAPGR